MFFTTTKTTGESRTVDTAELRSWSERQRQKLETFTRLYMAGVAVFVSVSGAIHGWAVSRLWEVSKEIHALQTDVKVLEASTPRVVPPPWFKELVMENRRRIERIERLEQSK